MPRPPRMTPIGLPFHVLNRGNERRMLFSEPGDFQRFVDRVERAAARFPIDVLAYCVMSNHWHFVVVGRADMAISHAFQWLSCGHACELRRKEGTVGFGHVYQRRFHSFPIGSKCHLLNVIRYVEANPLRAGLVRRAEDWRWASLWDRPRYSRQILAAELPVVLPEDWLETVNAPVDRRLMERLRTSVRDGVPFGPKKWAERAVQDLQLKQNPRT